MVCEVCRQVLAGEPDRRRESVSLEHRFNHHKNERELKEIATKGSCYICRVLYARLQEQPLFSETYVPLPEGTPFLIASVRKVTYKNQAFRLDFNLARSLLCGDGLPFVSFVLLQDAAGTARLQSMRPVSESTADVKALDLAGSWIDECESSHPQCRRPSVTFYPTRLLEVMTEDGQENVQVRLVSQHPDEKLPGQADFSGPYASLSHRWADSRVVNIIQLKRALLARYQAGIAFDSLLLSFQHAVTVARRLKIRWLWIDSLCIVQDDEDDWLQESATMDRVYQYSYCNISATAAIDSSHSLFRKRNPEHDWCQTGYLHYGDYPETSIEIPCIILDLSFWEKQVKSTSVNRRSWVLQERVLSSRVLHFCSDQIAFECRESTRAECRPLGLPIPSVSGSEVEDTLLFKRIDSTAGRQLYETRLNHELTWSTLEYRATDLMPKWYLYEVWKSKVEDYTRMGISKATDRLIALSGIARMMHATMIQEGCGDQYLAGLWQGAFESQLLWHVNEAEGRGEEPQPLIKLRPGDDPKQYTAPTWSWASCESPRGVTFAVSTDKDVLIEMNIARLLYRDVNDTFGKVTDGYIVVTGVLRRICLTDNAQEAVAEQASRIGYLMYCLQQMEKRVFGSKLARIEFDPPRRRWQVLGQLVAVSVIMLWHCLLMRPNLTSAIISILICTVTFIMFKRPALIEQIEDDEPGNRWSWQLLDMGKAVGKKFTVVYLDSPASHPTIFGPDANVFVIPALETREHLVCLMVQAIGGDYGIRYKRIGLTKILAIEKNECTNIKTPPSQAKNAGGKYYFGPAQRRPGESTICII